MLNLIYKLLVVYHQLKIALLLIQAFLPQLKVNPLKLLVNVQAIEKEFQMFHLKLNLSLVIIKSQEMLFSKKANSQLAY